MINGKLYLGTSGYNYKDWKGKFYPDHLLQKDWLSYYAQYYDSVEINNSFYVAVKKETYEKWYDQTPKNFPFAIKGHRYITQLKKLKDVEDATAFFFEHAYGLKEKLSVVLWQFPANFKLSTSPEEHYDRLKVFLDLLPTTIPQAFEFRDISWFTDEVNQLLKKHNASLVISQSGVFPEKEMLNETFAYIRFHGQTSLYSSGYSNADLAKWAEKIRLFLKTQNVYCYFNNDAGGYALDNARTLQNMLKKS